MPLMDRMNNVRSNSAKKFNSVRESLTVENVKTLPGKFVAAVVAVFSFIGSLVAKPFVWSWSKVPAAPQPSSLWSRISNFLFKPSKPDVVVEKKPVVEKHELAGKITEQQVKPVESNEIKNNLTTDLNVVLASKQTAITPLAESKKKSRMARVGDVASGVVNKFSFRNSSKAKKTMGS